MEDNQFRYKKKRPGFGNVQVGRVLREVAQQENRRKRRSALYNSVRGIAASASPVPVVPAAETRTEAQILQEDRQTKLLRWKAEKELQKKLQAQLRKPVFRAGVYHHKLNSPIYMHQVRPAVRPSKVKSPVRRITRATAKRLAAKAESTVQLPAPTPVPVTQTTKHREVQKNSRASSQKLALETSFAPKNHQFKAPDGLSCVPLFGQAALTSYKKGTASATYFSPYVVISRGKAAARIEKMSQLETSITEYLPKEVSTNQTDSRSTKTRIEEVEGTPAYFRSMTENVISALRAMCSLWEVVRSDINVPEEAQLLINQTIGQTNLLIDKKFRQFKDLVSDCESGRGEKKVTCEDLQGFWDMVYMQVEDCNSRFDKLVKLKDRDWKEEAEEAKPKKAKKVVVKKRTSRRTNGSSKLSSVRDMIRAARKKKKESQDRSADYQPTEENPKENCDPNTPEQRKLRKSTRKSVRFTGEDCTACSELKPVYSMTPRVKRSSRKFREKSVTPKRHDRSQETSANVIEDFIVFETPTKPPPRVRRSARLQRAQESN